MMIQTYTLTEYLNAEIEPDRLYEIEGGQIIDMPPESFQNVCIIFKLVKILLAQINPERISNKTEIIVSGSRFNSRFPDLVIFTEEQVVHETQYTEHFMINKPFDLQIDLKQLINN